MEKGSKQDIIIIDLVFIGGNKSPGMKTARDGAQLIAAANSFEKNSIGLPNDTLGAFEVSHPIYMQQFGWFCWWMPLQHQRKCCQPHKGTYLMHKENPSVGVIARCKLPPLSSMPWLYHASLQIKQSGLQPFDILRGTGFRDMARNPSAHHIQPYIAHAPYLALIRLE